LKISFSLISTLFNHNYVIYLSDDGVLTNSILLLVFVSKNFYGTVLLFSTLMLLKLSIFSSSNIFTCIVPTL